MTTPLPSSPRSTSKIRAWAFFLVLALVAAFAPIPVQAAPTDRLVRIEASSFAFAPDVVRVNPGDRVTVEIVATDVVHGFALDIYDVSISADPGQTARLTFTADRPGVYRFRCPTACGQLHPFMTGKLVVGPNLLLWRAAALGLLAVIATIWTLR